MSESKITNQTIEDMKSYYEARASEYDEWFCRRGRYDYGDELNNRWHADATVVQQALTQFNMTGDILELAPGTGIWTEHLISTAQSITAVDGSPGMIEINRHKVDNTKVHYIVADLFEWEPEAQYDGVFFGFWISHVPSERLEPFLQKVSNALKPGGRIFFVDSRPDPTMSAANHVLPEEGSQIMKRKLNDGRSYDIVKNFFEPCKLEQLCDSVGLDIMVSETPHYFFYAQGQKPKR